MAGEDGLVVAATVAVSGIAEAEWDAELDAGAGTVNIAEIDAGAGVVAGAEFEKGLDPRPVAELGPAVFGH